LSPMVPITFRLACPAWRARVARDGSVPPCLSCENANRAGCTDSGA
jgi:hypothetical protein